MTTIDALASLSFMTDIRNKIVFGGYGSFGFKQRDCVSYIPVLNWEVDDCGILLDEKVILCKPLWRKPWHIKGKNKVSYPVFTSKPTFMCKIRYGGKCSIVNLLRPDFTVSSTVLPSNFCIIIFKWTCGIALRSMLSWNNGVGGSPSARNKKGTWQTHEVAPVFYIPKRRVKLAACTRFFVLLEYLLNHVLCLALGLPSASLCYNLQLALARME